MPTTDQFGGYTNVPAYCAKLVVYLNPAGPTAPKDGNISVADYNVCFGGLPFTRNQPVNSQSFASLIATLDAWKVSGLLQVSPAALQANADAFQQLCNRFPRCHVSPPNVCSNKYDESRWASKSQYPFLIGVITLIAWKLVLEAGKAVVIVASMSRSRLPAPQWTPLLQSSPMLPAMYLVGFDPWLEVLLYRATTADRMRTFVWKTLLTKVTKLGLTFWYFNRVLQTGFRTLDYLSLLGGMLALPFELVQAVRASRRMEAEKQARDASMTEVFNSATRSSVFPHETGEVEDFYFELTDDKSSSESGRQVICLEFFN
jgi:hypothetical protein